MTGLSAFWQSTLQFALANVRARAESQGAECNIGIAERAVRMIILMIGAIIGYFAGDIYFTYIIYILVILSYFTVAQRIVYVWRQLK